MRMLVTRPQPEAAETAARLGAIDIETTILPLLVYRTLTTILPDATGFAAVALTSANALRALADREALEAFRSLKAYAVGDRTAEVAREHGFAEVESAGGSLSDLVGLLAHAGIGPIFYPAAHDQSGDLAKSLAPYGVMVVTARIYAMDELPDVPPQVVGELEDGSIGAALFYSRRTAAAFASRVAPRLSRATRMRLGALCLSETVAGPLIDARFARISLADYPSEEAMMSLALSFARDQNTP